MSLAFDETGRPYIIIREQDKKRRLKGQEAYRVKKIIYFINYKFKSLKKNKYNKT